MIFRFFSRLFGRLCWGRLPQGWLRATPVLPLLLVVAIALSGCNPTAMTTQAAQVPRIVIADLGDPKTFNGPVGKEANPALGLMFTGLLEQDGTTGELVPGLAESWDISDDQQRITFTLREGLKWSDGAPLTVEDVIFSFNDIYFNPEIPSGESDILRVGAEGKFPTVNQVGDRQVEFISPEPFAPLLRFAGGISILPKHVLSDYVFSTGADGKPRFLSAWGTDTPPSEIICNGPYTLKSYQPAERIVLERNPNYWRKDEQGNPQPYIEQYVIQIAGSTDTALIQFRSGGLDVLGVTPDYFALMKREEERGNFKIYNGGPALTTTFLAFNLNQGSRNGTPLVDPIKSRWFNTVEFRQAVAYAIDRQRLINNIYQGLGVPQNSPIYQQSPYALTPENGLPVYDYNLDQAKQLLQQAGFRTNAQGRLADADGNLVRFTLITNAGNKIRESLGAQIKQDLDKLGITVDFQPIAFNTLVGKLSDTLDWEAHILGFSGAGVEPDGSRNVWSVNGTLHAFNQGALSGQDPIEGRVIADWEQRISDLYIQGSQQLDDDQRKAIYAETQRLAQEYVPFIHLVNALSLSAVRNTVEGVKFSALGGALWNIYELQKLSPE
ncbi:MAG: ABC transporter substrate-binding protein [Cyanobacteria bacterium J069]|nr:MAG: ABC transporter substrate-binding protein [Cyanobacteria bacterium J069]